MADAGEIKARVIIEYDGSGIDAAKSDLEKLAEMAGGFGGEGGIGDAISVMGDSFAEGTKGAEEFANAIEATEEPLKSGEEAVSSFNDALEEHNQAVEEAGTAHENLQQSVAGTGTVFEDASGPVQQFTESFQGARKSVAEIQAAMDEFNQADPWGSFNTIGQSGGSIGEALWATGEQARVAGTNVSGFATSTEEANKAAQSFLGADSAQYFSDIGGSATNADRAISEFLGTTQDTGTAIADVNKVASGGFFGSLFGEGGALGKVGEGVGGFFGGIGDAVGGLMMGLNEIAMPLMAVQMLGSMAQSAGSWLYNANLAAEGPNASNPASFTSQASQFGANASQGGNQFAVGFGAGLNPSLNAWNNASENQSGTDFWGGIGKFLGGATGSIGDVLQVAGGSLLAGLSFGNAGMLQTGTSWENSGMQGLINMYDAANGIPLQYPGTAGPYGGYTPSGRFQQMALSDWSSQPGGMTSAQQNVAADWQYFNSMPTTSSPLMPVSTSTGQAYGGSIQNPTEPGGLSNLTDPSTWSDIGKSIGQAFQGSAVGQDISQMVGGAGQTIGGIGSFFGGLGNDFMHFWDPTGDLNNLGSGPGGASGLSVGNTRGIGNYLQDTSQGGGQSLEHTFTAKANWVAEGLEHTFQGVASWIGQGLSHAFNAVASWIGQGLSHAFTGVANWVGQGLEHAFNAVASWIGQGLENTFQGVASWVGQNLEKNFIAVASWIGQNLSKDFAAVASWTGKNLEHTFLGVASWVGQNLMHTFVGVASWIGQGLSQMFSPTGAPMFAEGVSGFEGGPAIVGEAGTEVAEHNGQFAVFDQGATFVNLPSGSSVYPMQDFASYTSPKMFADGTGGTFSPVFLGSMSGGPQTANIHVYLDSSMLMQALGASLMQNITVGMGKRSY